MKNILLVILLALTFNGYSQTIIFSDNNFKAALISAGVDTDNNTEISQSEAAAVTELNVSSQNNITDLTGMEYFINLTKLNIGYLNVNVFNLPTLTKLVTLMVSGKTPIVDLSHNLLLHEIGFQGVGLTCIDLSQHTHLTGVALNNNPISGIVDISKSTGLIICQFGSCPNVTKICVPVGSVESAANGNFVKDATASWSEACAANEGMSCIKTSVAKFSTGQFNVYPTVFSETFNIEIGEAGTFDIVIVDITGKVLSSSSLSGKGTHVLGNNLSRGMYVVKISGMDKFQTFKIEKN